MGGKKTYLSEFCAHEDEENESQELARRLHLLPPVCAEQRSHMQVGSLCVHPARQSVPPGSVSLTLLVFVFFVIIIAKLLFDPSEAQQQKDLSQGIVCVHIQFTSEAIFVASPRRSSRPHLFIAATDCAEHRTRKHGPVL